MHLVITQNTAFEQLHLAGNVLYLLPCCVHTEGNALGMAISDVLDDYFMRSMGKLAAVSLVRCGVSDEGAKYIARGISTSSTLTHLDMSGSILPYR